MPNQSLTWRVLAASPFLVAIAPLQKQVPAGPPPPHRGQATSAAAAGNLDPCACVLISKIAKFPLNL